ncbi:hypothetical protein AMTR_s00109p00119580 [Amborella trichopoda]|uniref:Uncharacterized protein n=1 Tax=Amborella trichopoda TaxID=13333 RepID=W1NVJ0_AMBTC|nr:hypothetical protein AMTR_s00109p00119580 [Amborella trichopoda]
MVESSINTLYTEILSNGGGRRFGFAKNNSSKMEHIVDSKSIVEKALHSNIGGIGNLVELGVPYWGLGS